MHRAGLPVEPEWLPPTVLHGVLTEHSANQAVAQAKGSAGYDADARPQVGVLA